jgi:NitT/TauT family transport system substrate-binding protein
MSGKISIDIAGKLAAVFTTAMVAAFAVTGSAHATDVKFTLDWTFQGPQSPFVLAAERGYFAAEGLNVTIDRGEGSGAVPPRVASGAYDIGVGDINPLIRFNADKPEAGLIAVAVLYDASPLAAITLKKFGVTEPKHLAGKTIAAPETDSGRQLFPAFAKATGIDLAAINWMSVSPQLRETMLAQGQAQAITGFLTSGILSLNQAGIPTSEITVLRYRDYGVDLYSNALITTKKFAEANPKAITGFIRAAVKGHIDAIKDPEAAIEALKKRDPLIDPKVELARLTQSMAELVTTEHVKSAGFSQIEPERFQKALDILGDTYRFPRKLTIADVYTDKYLPPIADLTFSK